LHERSSPELIYLETKFAALVSYGLTAELLKEVLPISQDLSTTAIRQQVLQTAQRLEDELGEEQDMFVGGCQRDWDQLPNPAAPLIVGINGGYVHAKDQRRELKDGLRIRSLSAVCRSCQTAATLCAIFKCT